jgi:hypothetical protein
MRDCLLCCIVHAGHNEMSMFRKIAKLIAPYEARQFIKKSHRDFMFRRAMGTFLKDPSAAVASNSHLLQELYTGWDNGNYTAQSEFAMACIKEALAAKGSILECGSGLTTPLIAAVCQRTDSTLYTLEHSQPFGDRVIRCLQRYGLTSARVLINPLKSYGEFDWYAPPMEQLPEDIALVICDGPPGDTRGGRYGVVPVMKERLRNDCVILLDDTARDAEQRIAKRWASELNVTYDTLGHENPYVRMALDNPRAQVSER